MNPHLLNPWEPYEWIVWGGQTYMVLTRVEEDDFEVRRRFMVTFPDGKKRTLSLSATKKSIEDLYVAFGKVTHDEIVRQIVHDEALKEIKAAAKTVSLPKVSPNVKLVPLDMEPPLAYTGVDFAKVESEMMAHLLAKGGLPKDLCYTPSPLSGTALSVFKAEQAMQDSLKEMALKYAMKPINPAYFGHGTLVLDSLAGVSKEEVFKVLYGGTPEPKPQVTEKGLATLKKYGVALAG